MSRLFDALERARRDRAVPALAEGPAAPMDLGLKPVDLGIATELRPRPAARPAPRTLGVQREMASLLAAIRPVLDQQGSLIVHLTSTLPREGTSTIARELATVAARQDWCKVLMLDAAGLRPASSGGPSAGAGPPLLGSFMARGEIAPIPVLAGRNQMWTADLVAPNSSSPPVQSVRDLYTALRQRYTLVLVDCPPLMSVMEIAALSEVADGVILVVAAESTRVPVIQRARANLEAGGATILGVVFNKRRNYIPSFLYRYI